MFPDDINLSDAILLALRNIGWIGPLKRKGEVVAPPKRIAKRRYIPLPAGLIVPPGLTWNSGNGRFQARIWLGHRPTVTLGTCGPIQAEIDTLGALWRRMADLRDAGATVEDIRQAFKEAA